MQTTALITGGSRGIGLGIAKTLAALGFDLAINGVRSEAEVASSLDELSANGNRIVYVQGDIASGDDRSRVVTESIKALGSIDVLINNAGVAPRVRSDIMELTEEDFDFVMDINLKGTFFLTQEVASHMVQNRKNRPAAVSMIINITSVSAEVASVNRAAYCMAKAGLSMMTKLWAARLGEHQIPVYEIQPGIIATDMTSAVKEKYDDLIGKGLTIEKRWGTPEDIGAIVATLVAGGIPYSTGQVFHADGGMGIRRL